MPRPRARSGLTQVTCGDGVHTEKKKGDAGARTASTTAHLPRSAAAGSPEPATMVERNHQSAPQPLSAASYVARNRRSAPLKAPELDREAHKKKRRKK